MATELDVPTAYSTNATNDEKEVAQVNSRESL